MQGCACPLLGPRWAEALACSVCLRLVSATFVLAKHARFRVQHEVASGSDASPCIVVAHELGDWHQTDISVPALGGASASYSLTMIRKARSRQKALPSPSKAHVQGHATQCRECCRQASDRLQATATESHGSPQSQRLGVVFHGDRLCGVGRLCGCQNLTRPCCSALHRPTSQCLGCLPAFPARSAWRTDAQHALLVSGL